MTRLTVSTDEGDSAGGREMVQNDTFNIFMPEERTGGARLKDAIASTQAVI